MGIATLLIVNGCVLTLHKMAELSKKSESRLHDLYIQGFITSGNFSHINRQSKTMRQCINLAKMYLLSRSPVVIYGEAGDSSEEKQAQFLFENDDIKGALYDANYGTLHIGNIHKLTS